jgi:hypothetical protein
MGTQSWFRMRMQPDDGDVIVWAASGPTPSRWYMVEIGQRDKIDTIFVPSDEIDGLIERLRRAQQLLKDRGIGG